MKKYFQIVSVGLVAVGAIILLLARPEGEVVGKVGCLLGGGLVAIGLVSLIALSVSKIDE